MSNEQKMTTEIKVPNKDLEKLKIQEMNFIVHHYTCQLKEIFLKDPYI